MAIPTLFKHGSTWVRADFHLHTQADKEFRRIDNPNAFVKPYIDQLESQAVRVGIITNHNKFDKEEYKALRKNAAQRDIYLLPGVELSVRDGANGVHCLLVFDRDKWLVNGEDYINQFLTSAFEGIANRENENARCRYSLDDMLKKLQEHQADGRDSFVVMAHVEVRSGFLKEFEGGRIAEMAKDDLFKRFVLGFQKIRTRDYIEKLNQWFGRELPAFVEGSDCKNMDEVGRAHQERSQEKRCYLKIGNYSFEAVKYALVHHKERVRDSPPREMPLYLANVRIVRSNAPLSVPLNAGLNTVIGVRGGGKSSLLESIRFGLGLPAKNDPSGYKDTVVERLLGNGGQIELDFCDGNRALKYSVRRLLGRDPQVLDASGRPVPDLRADNLMHIAYFGQKDLAVLGENFNEQVFEETLLKEELRDCTTKIVAADLQVRDVLHRLDKVKKETAREEQVRSDIAALENSIRSFEDSGAEAMLRREQNFGQDATQLDIVADRLSDFAQKIQDVLEGFDVEELLAYQVAEPDNRAFFDTQVFPHIRRYLDLRDHLRTQLTPGQPEGLSDAFEHLRSDFDKRLESLQQEFAAVKRSISTEIPVEKYSEAKRKLQIEREKLATIRKDKEKETRLREQLDKVLANLQNIWQVAFETVEKEVQKLNEESRAIQIKLEFQGDKQRFKDCLKKYVSGARLRDTHFDKICEAYKNTKEIYADLYQTGKPLQHILSGGTLMHGFVSSVEENLEDFLTCRTPDKYTFEYHGKALEHYSIGQKATALIAFILSHNNKTLFLIDQPEDDLDNHTVAQEIISRIKKRKEGTQFVFVTHNPNILVLGDSEQVVVCEHDSELQTTRFNPIGSIDNPDIQQTAVKIMEGGKEAFDRRKDIYQLWKH